MSLSATPKAFRVLAFGASLTEGFVGGWTPYPYAAHLQAPLEAFFSKDATVKIVIDGQGGDQVVSPPGRFLPRLEKHCQKGEDRYDWILVMGGTNDIGGGTKAEEVYQGLSKKIFLFRLFNGHILSTLISTEGILEKCWTVALNSGAKVLAMNILEAGYPDKTLIQTRKTLNTLILDHKEKNVFVPHAIVSSIHSI